MDEVPEVRRGCRDDSKVPEDVRPGEVVEARETYSASQVQSKREREPG